mmetsp:Transcript_40057/g.94290  ORF Transcript_40057/g.94290 Transcript_40057/m.94290 type:complete len:203 (-) Transcript_40057:535-1143(-)
MSLRCSSIRCFFFSCSRSAACFRSACRSTDSFLSSIPRSRVELVTTLKLTMMLEKSCQKRSQVQGWSRKSSERFCMFMDLKLVAPSGLNTASISGWSFTAPFKKSVSSMALRTWGIELWLTAPRSKKPPKHCSMMSTRRSISLFPFSWSAHVEKPLYIMLRRGVTAYFGCLLNSCCAKKVNGLNLALTFGSSLSPCSSMRIL